MLSFPFRVLISIPLYDVFPVKPRHFHEKMVQEDAKQSDDGSERVSKKSATGQCGATVGVLTPIKKRTEVLKFFGGQKLL